MRVKWMKCQGDVWCKLDTVNLAHSHFDSLSGVYVIWHAGTTPATVYVGKGVIRDRLIHHRNNPDIQKYSSLGLYVTWSAISNSDQEGAERFLAGRLNPSEGERHPKDSPVAVNLPW